MPSGAATRARCGRSALDRHARRQLRAGRRSAGDPQAIARAAIFRSMRAATIITTLIKPRLKNLGRWLIDNGRRRHQSLCRYRRGDGEAARRGGRSRLAGQAHQSGVAAARLVAVPRRDLHHARSAARRGGARSLRHLPAPASISARPRLSRRRIVSMRGAAFPTSPSSTRAPSRASCAPLIGNRIYGCDDCLAVCPWNKFAGRRPRNETCGARALAARRILPIWRGSTMRRSARCFAKSAVKRIGRARFIRNVLIAIGNSADASLAAEAERLLDDASPLVRGAAVWALGRLDRARLEALRRGTRRGETDPEVIAEWAAARALSYRCPRSSVSASAIARNISSPRSGKSSTASSAPCAAPNAPRS